MAASTGGPPRPVVRIARAAHIATGDRSGSEAAAHGRGFDRDWPEPGEANEDVYCTLSDDTLNGIAR